METETVEREATQQVVIRLQDRFFGLPIAQVREMLGIPAITELPHVPPHVLGVMNLRGRVIPVVDLRLRLGMNSSHDEVDELVAMLTQREQDHRNWLEELESCVREGRTFRLATDPHMCAFGRWYDTFSTDNLVLANHLKKFDAPHKRIHAIASHVIRLMADGAGEEAFHIIAQTRETELATVIQLFDQLRHLLQETNRTIAVVLDTGGGPYAVSVDEVTSVEWLHPAPTEGHLFEEGRMHEQMVCGMAQPPGGERLVSLLDVDAIAGQFVAA